MNTTTTEKDDFEEGKLKALEIFSGIMCGMRGTLTSEEIDELKRANSKVWMDGFAVGAEQSIAVTEKKGGD